MKKEWICCIIFINVGNGDSILIQAKDEAYKDGSFVMLIDGGSNEASEYEYKESGRIRAIDFLEKIGITHIDIMVNTHIHEDHTCGLLPIVKRWKPNEFWQPFPKELVKIIKPIDITLEKCESAKKISVALENYKEISEYVQSYGGKLSCIFQNQEKKLLAKNLQLEVLGPKKLNLEEQMDRFRKFYENTTYDMLEEIDKKMNNVSLCFGMTYGEWKFLLSGDTECDGYGKLINADVYKVGHHGQANSMNEKLVKQIQPKEAIICASSDRRYNSASNEVLELLEKIGARMYFTDCPQIVPYTNNLRPHNGVCVLVQKDYNMKIDYIEDSGELCL